MVSLSWIGVEDVGGFTNGDGDDSDTSNRCVLSIYYGNPETRHSTSRVAAVAAAQPNRRASVAISCRVGPAHPGADARTSSSSNSGTDTRTGLSDRRRSSSFLRCFCWARCCPPGNGELLEGSALRGNVGSVG